MVRPASFATSTKVTGNTEGVAGLPCVVAASRRSECFQFQRGLTRASSSEPPRSMEDEPRKRRRGKFMERLYPQSWRPEFQRQVFWEISAVQVQRPLSRQ